MIKLRHLIREADIDPNHNIEGGTRSVELDREKTKIVLARKCRESMAAKSTGSQIFRGLLHSGPAPFRLVRPQRYYRMARNTDNFVNSLLDVIPTWRDWPKRSRSIVCSSSPAGAGWYGKVFEVFPFDGAVLGICPATDFWNSFPYVSDRLGVSKEHEVDWFNYSIPDVLKTLGYSADFWRYTPEDAKRLMKYLDEKIGNTPDIFQKVFEIGEERGMHSDTKRILLDMKAHFKTAESYFGELFDPEKNKFEKVQMSEYRIRHPETKEVWTESTSLMIAPQAMELIIPPKPHGIQVTNADGTKEFWPIKGK